ncbi:DUF389 domain-containing protein [Sphingobacterium spiritivorum]|uniref:DUF389 domain-containing protein n=1 Tax=Sphingobacterium spiritivorum TaxID=258 RepID=UPI003DA4DAFC
MLIATLVSLSVSFIYFLLSPFKDAQSELLARTSPNIYDVLIAFFGGLVGVIAITRVEKGNPIPGVAIATALMPPLCTAGYGLAIGNLSYFAGALYLYSINCFFICISTFFIVKYLKYPKVKFVDKGREKRITRTITLLIMVMIIPSFYLAYVLLQQKKYTQLVDHFINTELVQKGYTVVYEKTSFNSNPKKIELAFLSRKFTPEEIKKLNLSLSGYGIFNTQLIIRQDSTDLKKDILEEINKRSENLSQKDIAIRNLTNELAMYKFDDPKLINEIDILFPEIKVYSVGKQLHVIRQDSTVVNTVLLYEAESPLSDENKSKLQTWLGSRINDPHIEIVRR